MRVEFSIKKQREVKIFIETGLNIPGRQYYMKKRKIREYIGRNSVKDIPAAMLLQEVKNTFA